MKNIILVPLAGRGQRFVNKGFYEPKQLLQARNLTCIEWSLQSLCLEDALVVFIIRRGTEVHNSKLKKYLSQLPVPNSAIIEIDEPTRGSLETCFIAAKELNPNSTLTIFTGDVFFMPQYKVSEFSDSSFDGWLLSFKSNSADYSYVELDNENFASRTAEKVVISNSALVGVYGFKSISFFMDYAERTLKQNPEFGGEYYIAPMYNHLISDGGKIFVSNVDEMHLFGTPEEYKFFQEYSSKSFLENKIVGVCSDHSGFMLKEKLKSVLADLRVEFIDFGSFTEKDSDYNDYIDPAMRALIRGDVDYVFSSCRSGQGVHLAASTFKGVLSTFIHDVESSYFAVRHNSANNFCFPSSIWEGVDLHEVVHSILSTRFQGGRHQGRIMRVLEDQKSNANFR
jgi:RpiB/LacA/LacB family sugar-phosphate isomerase